MKIRIPYKKTKNKEEAFKKLKEKVNEEALAKLNIKADLFVDEENKYIRAEGSGFSFRLYCLDTEAEADLDLGFMLSPFQSKIEKTLRSKIERLV